MKAIVREKYCSTDSLRLKDMEKPVPADNEILLKVKATSINDTDRAFVEGKPFVSRFFFGLFEPKQMIPGGDVSGIVETVGKNVTIFKTGDQVFGNLAHHKFGAFAEFVTVPEHIVALKPQSISFEEAAAASDAARTALQGIRRGKIAKGQKVLIHGASGGVGSFALQIAKSFDTEVTAVCSTNKLEMAKSAGADYVVDYRKEDFAQNEGEYDLIIAVNGNRKLTDYKKALAPKGTCIVIGGGMKQLYASVLFGSFLSEKHGRTIANMGMAKESTEDLYFLAKLLNEGKVKPIIDKTWPLQDIAEAFRHFKKGRTVGKLVITV